MSFPSPSLVPPTLSVYQMSFRGLSFSGIAAASAYQLQSLTGIDLPPYISADVQRALDQGEFNGLDLAQGRDIVLQQAIKGDATSLDHARQALGAVLGVNGATDEPLYLQLPSGLFACMARPRKHNFPLDITTVLAGAAQATTMWHATDPRWYSVPSNSSSVGIPAKTGGLSFGGPGSGVSFGGPGSGVSFGGGSTGGFIEANNEGPFETRPIFIVTGPCTNPVISNLSIPGAPFIGFEVSLATGDQLVIDTDMETVVLTSAGTSGGISREDTIMAATTWFNLPPGVNQIEFTTSDAAAVSGTLTCQFADAYLAL